MSRAVARDRFFAVTAVPWAMLEMRWIELRHLLPERADLRRLERLMHGLMAAFLIAAPPPDLRPGVLGVTIHGAS